MRVNRNEFVTAFSFTLDFLEKSIRDNVTNHNKRVSLIAVYLGQALGLNDRELFDLSAYAMLHDNGITHPDYNIMSENGVDRLERSLSHCIQGEKNIAAFPFLEKRENIIKYHHEAYDGGGYFGISGGDIPHFAQIIALADTTEMAFQSGKDKADIQSDVQDSKNSRYSPALCEAFESVVRAPSFWLSLDNMFIDAELNSRVPVFYIDLEYPELLQISDIMSGIIDAKSPFTGEHSKGLSHKVGVMCDYYGFSPEKKTRMMIAADLHDVGKMVIPNSIIDKPGKLTPEEFDVIKSHTFYTRKVIESVKGFEDICEWASNHHEKLDGTGYPYGIPGERLGFEERLMGCMDIYQALTEHRPYRRGMSHEQACGILSGMAEKGYVSREITADITDYCRDMLNSIHI